VGGGEEEEEEEKEEEEEEEEEEKEEQEEEVEEEEEEEEEEDGRRETGGRGIYKEDNATAEIVEGESGWRRCRAPTPTPSLWGHCQSGIDAARRWSSEVTSCGRSDLKVGAQ
jgi:hypothetical protein